jgi:hypothetical protein
LFVFMIINQFSTLHFCFSVFVFVWIYNSITSSYNNKKQEKRKISWNTFSLYFLLWKSKTRKSIVSCSCVVIKTQQRPKSVICFRAQPHHLQPGGGGIKKITSHLLFSFNVNENPKPTSLCFFYLYLHSP